MLFYGTYEIFKDEEGRRVMFLHLQDDSPRGRGPGHRLLGQRGTPCDSLIFAQAGLIQQLLKVQWPVPAPVMGVACGRCSMLGSAHGCRVDKSEPNQ